MEQLVRLRHIRNNLAHTEGAFHEEMCTQKDIDWVRDFHKRILNQSDPLAILYQYSKANQQMVREKKQNPQYQVSVQLSNKPAKFDITNEKIRKTGVNRNTELKNLYWVLLFMVMVIVVLLEVFGIVALRVSVS